MKVTSMTDFLLFFGLALCVLWIAARLHDRDRRRYHGSSSSSSGCSGHHHDADSDGGDGGGE